jgi:hypothetical protein
MGLVDKEGRSEEIEHHKQDSLKKVKEGTADWKDALASNSESIVWLFPFPRKSQ